MKSKENNSYRMFLTVQMIMAKFAAIWAGLVSVETTNTEFDGLLTKIKSDLDVQKEFLNGYAAEKKKKKSKMATLAYSVCRKVRSYAYAVDDRELIGKLKISYSLIFYTTSSKAETFASNVLKAAETMSAADKTKFGLTAAEITALADSIKAYGDYTAKPRAEIVGRVVATDNISKNIKAVNRLLMDRMDNAMANFQVTDPDFFAEYKQGRRVIDLQHHTAIEGNVTDVNGNDLKKVKVSIIGKDKVTNEEKVKFEEITDKNGNFIKRVINPEFDYDVSFELSDYETKTYAGIDLVNGEHETIDVQLVKLPLA